MHPSGQFLGQYVMNHPMPLDPRFPIESICNDPQAEMGLPARPRTGMARMFGAVVGDFQFAWRKGLSQLVRYSIRCWAE